jgi:hypothetical protein
MIDEDNIGGICELIDLFVQNFNKMSICDMSLISKKPLRFLNTSGFNHDHRGSDHTKIILDFHSQYVPKYKINTIDGEPYYSITFTDFVDACYRVKSHKFENHYEMFLHINCKCPPSSFDLCLVFDHGS